MSKIVDEFLDALRRDEPADLSIERSPHTTEVKIGVETIARIDERNEELVVYAPADTRARLEAEYPEARPDPSGLGFDLRDGEQKAAGFRFLRNRARVQRVGWQYRERSP
jgi:hypothetical protein